MNRRAKWAEVIKMVRLSLSPILLQRGGMPMRLTSHHHSRRPFASSLLAIHAVFLFFLGAMTTAREAAAQGRPLPSRSALPEPPPPPTDVFLLELRRRSRGTDTQLAESIRDALRLKLDVEASRFLESIEQRQWDDAKRREITQIISADSLLRAMVDETITEKAKTQAAELLAAKKRIDESPERIAAAIPAIGSGDPERELPATRTLLSAGISAIGPLAVAAAQEPDSGRRDAILLLMARSGEASLGALSSLAIYGPAEIRAGAMASLDRLRSEAALGHLSVAVYASDATEAERDFASKRLEQQFGKIPSRAETQAYLINELSSLRRAAGRMARSEAGGVAWSVDPQSGVPVPTPTTAALAAQRQVADQSRLLYRLGNLSPSATQAAVTADLAYRFQIEPLAVAEQIDELRQIWGDEAFTAQSLSSIIDGAIADDDLAAAVAAMTLVSPSTAGNHGDLLTTGSADMTPLVKAVTHSVPQVRYEAALAILRLDYQSPFPGVSTVTDRLNEMASLSRDPVALIVDTRVERESQIERLIASLGYRVEVASSVAEAIRQVDHGGDLRLVITTSILPDRSALELVDAVRRHPFGLRIPIFIHGPYDSSIQIAVDEMRWNAPVAHIELPNSAAGWGVILEPALSMPIGRLQGFDPLSTAQRYDFRRRAILGIGKLTGSPDVYDFYGLDRMLTASIGGGDAADPDVAKVAFGDPRLALLSASASGQSQATLVEMILRPSSKEADFQAAAKALRASIDRHGVVMSGEVVRRLGGAAASMAKGPQQQAVAEIVELIANRFGFIVVGADNQ